MCFSSASKGNGIFGTMALIVALALASSAVMLCGEKIAHLQKDQVQSESSQTEDLVICVFSGITFFAGILQVLAAVVVLSAKAKMSDIGSCCLGFLYVITILPVMVIIGLVVVVGFTADTGPQGKRFENWFSIMLLDVLCLLFGSLVIGRFSRRNSQDAEQC